MASPREELTYVMIKPDGVQRGCVGEIISRFERRGFQLVALKMQTSGEQLLQQHYGEHVGKPFFAGLVKYMQSGPVVCMVWKGLDVVRQARKMIGATKPCESDPGTIRGDLAIDMGRNLIHGSDSVAAAQREIALWFTTAEIQKWEPSVQSWLYE